MHSIKTFIAQWDSSTSYHINRKIMLFHIYSAYCFIVRKSRRSIAIRDRDSQMKYRCSAKPPTTCSFVSSITPNLTRQKNSLQLKLIKKFHIYSAYCFLDIKRMRHWNTEYCKPDETSAQHQITNTTLLSFFTFQWPLPILGTESPPLTSNSWVKR